MIFRKPYKFLIKHFRLIHLIVCVLSIYLIYKNSLIINFFDDYINSTSSSYYSNVASKYISFVMYFVVILILGLQIFIYLLMKKKDKPRKYYILSIIYYIGVFFALTFAYGIFKTFENNIVEMQIAGIYRDIARLILYPQYLILVISLIRGIGFNLSKFNFSKDLQEMEIDARDNEEFEFVLGSNNYKVQRNIRRTLREISYYIRENKFIFFSICIFVAGLIFTIYYLNHNVYNKVYSENDSFNNSLFTLKVNKSYLTNIDYNGNKYDNYYLILKMDITNNSSANNSLNIDDYRIIAKDKTLYPTITMNERFVDLGSPYNNDNIGANKTVEKLLIYKIPEGYESKNYILRVVNELDFRVGSIMAKYYNTKIKPEKLDENKIKEEYSLNNEILFDKTNLQNSKLNIESYNISGSYVYEYNSCVNGNCSVLKNVVYAENLGNYILSIKYKLSLDDTSYKKSIRNNNYFFTNFMKVKYSINGKEKVTSVVNRTPKVVDNEFVCEIPSEVSNANNVSLVFKIRNYEYVIKLK